MTHSYHVRGMHCQSCVEKIETSLKKIDRVRSAKVNLDQETAALEMSSHIPLHELNAVLADGGYRLTEDRASALGGKSLLGRVFASWPWIH